VQQKIIKASKNRDSKKKRKCENSSNTRQAECVSTAADTWGPEKTSPRLVKEIWVGTKVGYGCQDPPTGPLITD